MLLKLLQAVLTGGVGKLADTYRDIRLAKLQHDNNVNATVKELELDRMETIRAANQNAKEIRIATKDQWEMRLAIGLVAIATSFHYVCVVIDHTYNMGWNVKPLPTPLDEWQGTIILSYFGLASVRHGVNVIAARLLSKR